MSWYDYYDWTEIDVVKADDGVCIRLYGGCEYDDDGDCSRSLINELKVLGYDLPDLIEKLERIVEEERP